MFRRLFGGGTPRDDLWSSMSSLSVMLSKLDDSGVAASARRYSGVIFKPDDANPFLVDLKTNLDDILYIGPGATKTAVEIKDDEYGMRWVVLDDGNFSDLLSSTYTVANAISQNGGAGSILAASFHLDFASNLITSPGPADRNTIVETYVIFRFDRNRYYPFIPETEPIPNRESTREPAVDRETGPEPEPKPGRDSATEAKLGAAMRSHGLAVEGDPRNWLGLWDIPF